MPWFLCFIAGVMTMAVEAQSLRVATFNVSMDGSNYVERGEIPTGGELLERLARQDHPQIRNIAAIIQTVRPDVLVLNEFDYIADADAGIQAFQRNYLAQGQHGQKGFSYPYWYTAPVNTGVDSGHDLDGDGKASGKGGDAFGFGFYPGQYGMVVLSRFPIDQDGVRTFQKFLWQDMPGNLQAGITFEDGRPWFNPQAKAAMRLSSKSHWDIPVKINGDTLHLLVSHPTPPVFDGEENRNGKRNHDEIRLWRDYLNNEAYLYDDQGQKGGFAGGRFLLTGDMNASPDEGDSYLGAIRQLTEHKAVNSKFVPTSTGGQLARPDNPHAASHTASWGMRADYVLPSKQGLEVIGGGVFWPASDEPESSWVAERSSSSDHRLVWLDIKIIP